jgi:hypothetical protein
MHEGNKYSPAEAQLTDVKRQSHLGRPDALVEPTPGLEAIAEPLRLPDVRRVEGPAYRHVPKNGEEAPLAIASSNQSEGAMRGAAINAGAGGVITSGWRAPGARCRGPGGTPAAHPPAAQR